MLIFVSNLNLQLTHLSRTAVNMSVEAGYFVLNPLLLSLEAVNLAGDLVSLVISFLFLPLFGSSLMI